MIVARMWRVGYVFIETWVDITALGYSRHNQGLLLLTVIQKFVPVPNNNHVALIFQLGSSALLFHLLLLTMSHNVPLKICRLSIRQCAQTHHALSARPWLSRRHASRVFSTTAKLDVVKPFLLADIGEGILLRVPELYAADNK